MACFGLGIRLKKEEKAKFSEIINLALYAAALINDYHSWPKEIKHHIETEGSEAPFNAVSILMRQYTCSELEALAKLHWEYTEMQEKHLSLVKKLEQGEGELSDTYRKYIMAAQYTTSESEFWSIYYVPRYPTKADLNQTECALADGAFKCETVDIAPDALIEPNPAVRYRKSEICSSTL